MLLRQGRLEIDERGALSLVFAALVLDGCSLLCHFGLQRPERFLPGRDRLVVRRQSGLGGSQCVVSPVAFGLPHTKCFVSPTKLRLSSFEERFSRLQLGSLRLKRRRVGGELIAGLLQSLPLLSDTASFPLELGLGLPKFCSGCFDLGLGPGDVGQLIPFGGEAFSLVVESGPFDGQIVAQCRKGILLSAGFVSQFVDLGLPRLVGLVGIGPQGLDLKPRSFLRLLFFRDAVRSRLELRAKCLQLPSNLVVVDRTFVAELLDGQMRRGRGLRVSLLRHNLRKSIQDLFRISRPQEKSSHPQLVSVAESLKSHLPLVDGDPSPSGKIHYPQTAVRQNKTEVNSRDALILQPQLATGRTAP